MDYSETMEFTEAYPTMLLVVVNWILVSILTSIIGFEVNARGNTILPHIICKEFVFGYKVDASEVKVIEPPYG